MKSFNEFIREKRLERGLSLRQFCLDANIDASNWSKIERGLMDSPKSELVLKSIADVLSLNEEEYKTMKDLAIISSIPKELNPDEELLDKLPLFFRTVRGDNLTEDDLKKLAETIRTS